MNDREGATVPTVSVFPAPMLGWVMAPPPDPAACSTDRIAYDRTVVEVDLGGQPVLRQSRPGNTWHPVAAPGGHLIRLTPLAEANRSPGR